MTQPWVMDSNCVKYFQVQLGCEELWPGHRFWVCVHCDLDLGDMTLGQGHATPLGHGQQLYGISFRPNLAVRSFGPDTDFEYVCSVNLNLDICSWVTVMTHGTETGLRYLSTVRPWPCRYNFVSRSWHTLGPGTTIVWNIIQIQLRSKELLPGHGF